MTITYETTLKDFEFWGPAHENVSKLTDEELDTLEKHFDEVCAVYDRTKLNDLFAYYFENVCALLGLDEEGVLARE